MILRNLQPDNMDPEKQFAEYGVGFHTDKENPTDSVFAFTDTYDHLIDTLARAFILNDKPFFLRVGGEMNGFWNGYTPWIFPLAYRKLVTELRNRGVANMAVVWCYEPDASADFADSTEQGWKWYVEDDMVDWFGLDLFDADHFDPDLPDEERDSLTAKGKTEKFLQFAEGRGKPVYLNELSARHVEITPDSLDPDSLDGIHDWEYWFAPFFEFLDLHPCVKAMNYINLLWTQIEQYKTWGDSRIEINTYIRKRWIQKITEPRFLY
jgi:hypothetical protein